MIVPLLHRIVVKQQALTEVNKDYKKAEALGIIIPEHEDNKRAQAGVDKGVVVSIGATAYRDFHTEVPIKVGDVVAFARYSGKVITDPATDEDFVALNDEDIVAILEN
jgi:co-chaperonin GroES (HSP10)